MRQCGMNKSLKELNNSLKTTNSQKQLSLVVIETPLKYIKKQYQTVMGKTKSKQKKRNSKNISPQKNGSNVQLHCKCKRKSKKKVFNTKFNPLTRCLLSSTPKNLINLQQKNRILNPNYRKPKTQNKFNITPGRVKRRSIKDNNNTFLTPNTLQNIITPVIRRTFLNYKKSAATATTSKATDETIVIPDDSFAAEEDILVISVDEDSDAFLSSFEDSGTGSMNSNIKRKRVSNKAVTSSKVATLTEDSVICLLEDTQVESNNHDSNGEISTSNFDSESPSSSKNANGNGTLDDDFSVIIIDDEEITALKNNFPNNSSDKSELPKIFTETSDGSGKENVYGSNRIPTSSANEVDDDIEVVDEYESFEDNIDWSLYTTNNDNGTLLHSLQSKCKSPLVDFPQISNCFKKDSRNKFEPTKFKSQTILSCTTSDPEYYPLDINEDAKPKSSSELRRPQRKRRKYSNDNQRNKESDEVSRENPVVAANYNRNCDCPPFKSVFCKTCEQSKLGSPSNNRKNENNGNAYVPARTLSPRAKPQPTVKGNFINGNNVIGNDIRKTGLRPIFIDGSNVAMLYSKGKEYSIEGLKLCIDYFLFRGHEVKAFVPQFRLSRSRCTNPGLLDFLARSGNVIFTPSRQCGNRWIVPYDDRFIVQSATEFEGVVVSNDTYRDLLEENPAWRDTIYNRLLMFTWVGNVLMFPSDPLGKGGPSLEKFLSFPPRPHLGL